MAPVRSRQGSSAKALAERLGRCAALTALAAGSLSATSWAQSSLTPLNESVQIVLTIENHVFAPAEIHVKAGQRTQILVKNLDPTAEEFNSTSLKVEKVIAGKSEAIVRLRSLDPGRYPFIGEYHDDTAKGVVVAE